MKSFTNPHFVRAAPSEQGAYGSRNAWWRFGTYSFFQLHKNLYNAFVLYDIMAMYSLLLRNVTMRLKFITIEESCHETVRAF